MIRNPILPGFNPDPSIVRVGDDFYIATSTFEWYPGVQIHHSKDLQHWRLAARPLNRAVLLDMRGNPDSCGIWAPCLSWHNGLFHLIYTDVKRFDGNFKDSHNFLTTCPVIDGDWSDPVSLNSSGFDPSMFHDDDGRQWLVNMIWDGRNGRNRFGGIVLQEYCAEQGKLIGDISNIFKGTALGLTEAPHLYRRNGYYYLITAEGGTGYTHAMTIARSKNITGPYEPDPNGYLLTAKDRRDVPLQRAGHGDLVETPNGEHYLVHLCSRPLQGLRRSPMGRETAVQKTRWTEDDWLRLESTGPNSDGLPQLSVEAPDLPPHPWPHQPLKHRFDDAKLPAEFQWLRTPNPERIMSLDARPGHLRLIGRESLGSWFEQSLVARRQEHFRFMADTCVEFQPVNIQQTAGLVCYYNAHKYHYLYIGLDDTDARFIDVASCETDPGHNLRFPLQEGFLDKTVTDPRFQLPDKGVVWLRAEIDHQSLKFSFRIQNGEWQSLPLTLDYSLISDEAGKGEGASFTGAFVGMCCQDMSGQALHADFNEFSYAPVER